METEERQDLFPGSPHEKRAEQIARNILDKPNENKIIGLEGDWGSGKSYIIKKLEFNLVFFP